MSFSTKVTFIFNILTQVYTNIYFDNIDDKDNSKALISWM